MGDEGYEDCEPLEWIADNGSTIFLPCRDEDACLKGCDDAPELKDADTKGQKPAEVGGGQQSKAGMALNMASGGEQAMMSGCRRFCQTEFEFECFPGDSTVAVRNKGRTPLSQLHLGDEVLIVDRGSQSGDSSNWTLQYEPVISWLHYEPEKELEFVKVRHAMGDVRLTQDHLIFVRSDNGVAEAILARDVEVGHRVLSPWVDGSFAEHEVTEVTRVTTTGAYCPLLPSGVLLVDGTAVSCYMMPHDLATSSVWGPCVGALNKAIGRQSLHEIAHAVLLPVRLVHEITTQFKSQLGTKKEQQAIVDKDDADKAVGDVAKIHASEKNIEPIHPYGVFVYVLGKSFCV